MVAFLRQISSGFVFTLPGLLSYRLKALVPRHLGRLARECCWEPYYFTLVKNKIKSVFNLFVKLTLSHSLGHNTFNKLTFCSLKSQICILFKMCSSLASVNVCQPFTGIQHVCLRYIFSIIAVYAQSTYI